jgi:hypothetical protein
MYNIPLPANITHMIGNLLNGLDKDAKARIRIGVSAVCRVLVTGRYIWLRGGNRESQGPMGNRDNKQKNQVFLNSNIVI